MTTSPIKLAPPQPVAPVEATSAAGLVPLDQEVKHELDAKAETFVSAILNETVNSPAFQKRVNAIHNLGMTEIRAAASVSNRMLDRPVQTLSDGFFDEKAGIGRSLLDLRITIEGLDPSQYGNLLAPRKLLGLIPFGNHLQRYFHKYRSTQSHLNSVVNALYRGQDELQKDNAAIEQEKTVLWDMMQQLQQSIYTGQQIDAALSKHMGVLPPEKARVVQKELLFYVRQKVQDMLTQLAVSIQGYLALDLIRHNNLELIKGVDRATTTTVAALRTAVIVAQALANQKLVLDQIAALNTTTSRLIANTGRLMKKQATTIHRQATDTTVDIKQLQTAFDNIYATLDMIGEYKVNALDAMQQTVTGLAHEVARSQHYLETQHAHLS